MKQCVFWDHLKYGDMFIEKVPEWVVQCLDCAWKYKDDTVYTDWWWRRVWQFWVWYFKGSIDRRGEWYKRVEKED